MSHGGEGSKQCQKSVTYYIDGPLRTQLSKIKASQQWRSNTFVFQKLLLIASPKLVPSVTYEYFKKKENVATNIFSRRINSIRMPLK